MAVERLSFVPGEMAYHAMHTADHICRYSALKSICMGKKVLDVACGEGYGSYLLSKWGAKSVVGIDISVAAIESSKKNFTQKNINFLTGDVCNLSALLKENEKFDIICSFETIEHVSDVQAFLTGIKHFASHESVIMISAPNDSEAGELHDNPFHLRNFTFDGFKSETEAVLGPATEWLLGTPIQGYTLLKKECVTPADADLNYGLRGIDAGTLHMLPSQSNLSVLESNVSFWIGVWGKANADISVASPLSMTGFIEHWDKIESQARELENERATVRSLESTLADERRIAIETRKKYDAVISPAQLTKKKRKSFWARTWTSIKKTVSR